MNKKKILEYIYKQIIYSVSQSFFFIIEISKYMPYTIKTHKMRKKNKI